MASTILAAALVAGPALAHGGVYRGPGDTVPPGTKGRGTGGGSSGPRDTGRTGSPSGPTQPTPGRNTGGDPRIGGRNTGTTTTGPKRGIPLGLDLEQWQFWWEFNKDPYLDLKHSVFSGGPISGNREDFIVGRGLIDDAAETFAPSKTDIARLRGEIRKLLDDRDSNRDIVSSCLVALAKIGGDSGMLSLFKRFLRTPDQEERETAALALGISAQPEAVEPLADLALDTGAGRKLVGHPGGVDFRTRSFACYGLGLIAWRQRDTQIKRRVFGVLRGILDDARSTRRDVQVAALHGIRLLRPDQLSDAQRALRTEAVTFLEHWLARGAYAQIRAHAYTAIARLASGDPKLRRAAIGAFVRELGKRRTRTWVSQSLVLGLGELATPDDATAGAALRRYFDAGRDSQARAFAAIALGQVGGEKNREALLRRLVSAKTTRLRKPWIALGLAIRDHEARRADSGALVDHTAADAILEQYRSTRNPLFASGFAVALGILGYRDAGDVIEQRMLEYRNQDEACGYHALALGLMRYRESKEAIHELAKSATRRQKLITQASTALGLLGDKGIARWLVARMATRGTVAVKSAVAKALGFIGDRRSIDPLITIAADRGQKNLPRAFSIVALGLIGDKEPLPWNSKIAVNINYRANVETLTSAGATGVLDIL